LDEFGVRIVVLDKQNVHGCLRPVGRWRVERAAENKFHARALSTKKIGPDTEDLVAKQSRALARRAFSPRLTAAATGR
jgi:hypothetical protein